MTPVVFRAANGHFKGQAPLVLDVIAAQPFPILLFELHMHVRISEILIQEWGERISHHYPVLDHPWSHHHQRQGGHYNNRLQLARVEGDPQKREQKNRERSVLGGVGVTGQECDGNQEAGVRRFLPDFEPIKTGKDNSRAAHVDVSRCAVHSNYRAQVHQQRSRRANPGFAEPPAIREDGQADGDKKSEVNQRARRMTADDKGGKK